MPAKTARSAAVSFRGRDPKQRARFEPDGSYILEFPYSDDRELLGDILRHGAEVEVLAPAALRKKAAAAHAAAARRYVKASALAQGQSDLL